MKHNIIFTKTSEPIWTAFKVACTKARVPMTTTLETLIRAIADERITIKTDRIIFNSSEIHTP